MAMILLTQTTSNMILGFMVFLIVMGILTLFSGSKDDKK